jgi:hypothetical protein
VYAIENPKTQSIPLDARLVHVDQNSLVLYQESNLDLKYFPFVASVIGTKLQQRTM